MVEVERLDMKHCGPGDEAGWLRIPVDVAAFNLAGLVDGAFQELLVDNEVPAGHYCELRLLLGPGPRVTLENGESYELKVPSGSSSGFKIKGTFHVMPHGRTVLTVDFDLEASLKYQPNQGRYRLKPVAHIQSSYIVDEAGVRAPDGELVGLQSLVVPPEGETFRLGGSSEIEFPPGAVDDTTTFSVTRWTTEAQGVITDVYVFNPPSAFAVAPEVRLEVNQERLNGSEVYFSLGNERIPARLDGAHLVATAPHFTPGEGRQDISYSMILGSTWAQHYVGEGELNCTTRSAQVPNCNNNVECVWGTTGHADCSERPDVTAKCVSFEYSDGDGGFPSITANFRLSEEDISALTHSDSTIEWQLKFFKAGGRSSVIRWMGADTNLPGTVSDSTCPLPDEVDDIEQSSSDEMTAALVTLCPADLDADFPYYITYYFAVDTDVVASDEEDDRVRRSFEFEIIPGRLCDSCFPPILGGGVDLHCSDYVDAPDGESADSNYSWNCEGNDSYQVIDWQEPPIDGADFNLIPFERLTVRQENGVKSRIRGGSCDPDEQADPNEHVEPEGPRQPPAPGVVTLEEDDPAVTRLGPEEYWHVEPFGSGGSMIWTFNNDAPQGVENRMIYRFDDLEPGRYEIQVHIPNNYATAQRACYYVNASGGSWGVRVDQSVFFNEWVSLGVFEANEVITVDLEDLTHEPWLSRWVGYDAIRVLPAGDAELSRAQPACLE